MWPANIIKKKIFSNIRYFNYFFNFSFKIQGPPSQFEFETLALHCVSKDQNKSTGTKAAYKVLVNLTQREEGKSKAPRLSKVFCLSSSLSSSRREVGVDSLDMKNIGNVDKKKGKIQC